MSPPGTALQVRKPTLPVARPSIALALGGGGARGLAHILMLEVFDELGLKPKVIAGTSIGAVFGAAYASGLSAKLIRAHVEEALSQRFGIARRTAGEVEKFENVAAQTEEFRTATQTGSLECYRNRSFDAAGAWCHDDDAVAHIDGFIDVVSNQEHGRAASLPEAQHLILHAHARERIKRAQRLVQ